MSSNWPFELLLFSTDTAMVDCAVRAGVDAVVVDWENRGKDARQFGLDTQINYDTREDLYHVRRATSAPIICRVNGPGSWTREEIEAAVEGGATEILLPMVRTAVDVEAVAKIVDGRLPIGILIETLEAVACAKDFARLPLRRVYIGLNDLAISRLSPTIFDAVTDGTVDRLRDLFEIRFGFGGLTRPACGHPIRCRLLIAEMVRLQCGFSFLRRSFHRDVQRSDLEEGVSQIRQGLAEARLRSDVEIARDRLAFGEAVRAVTRSVCA